MTTPSNLSSNPKDRPLEQARRHTNYGRYSLREGNARAAIQNFHRAAALMEDAISADPDNSELYVEAGNINLEAAKMFNLSQHNIEQTPMADFLNKAETMYNEALELNPPDQINILMQCADAVFTRARASNNHQILEETVGLHKRAAEIARGSVILDPTQGDAYNMLPKILMNQAIAYNCVAESHAKKNREAQALALYDKAVKYAEDANRMQPNHPWLQDRKAFILTNAAAHGKVPQHLDKAEELINKAYGMYPKDPEVNYQLGLLSLKLKRTHEALARLSVAIEMNPQHAPAMEALGDFYNKTNEIDEAKRFYQSALKVHPHNSHVLAKLSSIHILQGNMRDGEETARQAVEINSLNAETHRNLARALLQSEEYEEAERYIDIAIRVDPNSPTGYILKARLLSVTDPAGADEIKAYEKALALSSNNSNIAASLARCYIRRGQPQKATAVLNNAINLQTETNIDALLTKALLDADKN